MALKEHQNRVVGQFQFRIPVPLWRTMRDSLVLVTLLFGRLLQDRERSLVHVRSPRFRSALADRLLRRLLHFATIIPGATFSQPACNRQCFAGTELRQRFQCTTTTGERR